MPAPAGLPTAFGKADAAFPLPSALGADRNTIGRRANRLPAKIPCWGAVPEAIWRDTPLTVENDRTAL